MTNGAWPIRSDKPQQDYSILMQNSNGIGVVYFIGSPDASMVKMGYTDSLPRRLRTHNDTFGIGASFVPLAFVRGKDSDHKRICAYFKKYLVKGTDQTEIFYTPGVLPYIVWLRDQYFVAITENEAYTAATAQTVIDADQWMPNENRITVRVNEESLFTCSNPWGFLPNRDITGDDYYTPEKIIVCARAALGGVIDLDPASHVTANQIVKALHFYTVSQNGLTQPWYGRVFLNPPFSSWPKWIEKIQMEFALHNVKEMVALGATRTQTAQYQEPLLRMANALCIISGRNAFWGITTKSNSPTDGHYLIYIGPNTTRFCEAFNKLGPTFISDPNAKYKNAPNALDFILHQETPDD